MELNDFMTGLERRNPGQPEFHQAVAEVAECILPFVNDNQRYRRAKIFERLTEPDRSVIFRVCWEDDKGQVRVNRGYRVQFNNSIGPYKGGLRFDKSVNLSILKFLGFEQIFKNSLTTLPMGAAKGGSDFNPKGKSETEVMRFCQAFMSELYRHIGDDTDVPAGDIGVGSREIGFLFGQYNRINHRFSSGVLTGKSPEHGGSHIRTEATGYGLAYFARAMLKEHGRAMDGRSCLISGSGNVAQYGAEKLIEMGAKVLTLSDRGGTLYLKDGLTAEQLKLIKEIKNERRESLAEFTKEFDGDYRKGQKPWRIEGHMAFPCATQNEIDEDDAQTLLKNGCTLVAEGANMPTSAGALKKFRQAGILFAPGKAANAGGVTISGLEMTQNALRLSWTRDQVDERLQEIMNKIHDTCSEYGRSGKKQSGQSDKAAQVNYVRGANIGGFVKVAEAMLDYGIV